MEEGELPPLEPEYIHTRRMNQDRQFQYLCKCEGNDQDCSTRESHNEVMEKWKVYVLDDVIKMHQISH